MLNETEWIPWMRLLTQILSIASFSNYNIGKIDGKLSSNAHNSAPKPLYESEHGYFSERKDSFIHSPIISKDFDHMHRSSIPFNRQDKEGFSSSVHSKNASHFSFSGGDYPFQSMKIQGANQILSFIPQVEPSNMTPNVPQPFSNSLHHSSISESMMPNAFLSSSSFEAEVGRNGSNDFSNMSSLYSSLKEFTQSSSLTLDDPSASHSASSSFSSSSVNQRIGASSSSISSLSPSPPLHSPSISSSPPSERDFSASSPHSIAQSPPNQSRLNRAASDNEDNSTSDYFVSSSNTSSSALAQSSQTGESSPIFKMSSYPYRNLSHDPATASKQLSLAEKVMLADPMFVLYFTSEWAANLFVGLTNLFRSLFAMVEVPELLLWRWNEDERNRVLSENEALKSHIAALKRELTSQESTLMFSKERRIEQDRQIALLNQEIKELNGTISCLERNMLCNKILSEKAAEEKEIRTWKERRKARKDVLLRQKLTETGMNFVKDVNEKWKFKAKAMKERMHDIMAMERMAIRKEKRKVKQLMAKAQKEKIHNALSALDAKKRRIAEAEKSQREGTIGRSKRLESKIQGGFEEEDDDEEYEEEEEEYEEEYEEEEDAAADHAKHALGEEANVNIKENSTTETSADALPSTEVSFAEHSSKLESATNESAQKLSSSSSFSAKSTKTHSLNSVSQCKCSCRCVHCRRCVRKRRALHIPHCHAMPSESSSLHHSIKRLHNKRQILFKRAACLSLEQKTQNEQSQQDKEGRQNIQSTETENEEKCEIGGINQEFSKREAKIMEEMDDEKDEDEMERERERENGEDEDDLMSDICSCTSSYCDVDSEEENGSEEADEEEASEPVQINISHLNSSPKTQNSSSTSQFASPNEVSSASSQSSSPNNLSYTDIPSSLLLSLKKLSKHIPSSGWIFIEDADQQQQLEKESFSESSCQSNQANAKSIQLSNFNENIQKQMKNKLKSNMIRLLLSTSLLTLSSTSLVSANPFKKPFPSYPFRLIQANCSLAITPSLLQSSNTHSTSESESSEMQMPISQTQPSSCPLAATSIVASSQDSLFKLNQYSAPSSQGINQSFNPPRNAMQNMPYHPLVPPQPVSPSSSPSLSSIPMLISSSPPSLILSSSIYFSFAVQHTPIANPFSSRHVSEQPTIQSSSQEHSLSSASTSSPVLLPLRTPHFIASCFSPPFLSSALTQLLDSALSSTIESTLLPSSSSSFDLTDFYSSSPSSSPSILSHSAVSDVLVKNSQKLVFTGHERAKEGSLKHSSPVFNSNKNGSEDVQETADESDSQHKALPKKETKTGFFGSSSRKLAKAEKEKEKEREKEKEKEKQRSANQSPFDGADSATTMSKGVEGASAGWRNSVNSDSSSHTPPLTQKQKWNRLIALADDTGRVLIFDAAVSAAEMEELKRLRRRETLVMVDQMFEWWEREEGCSGGMDLISKAPYDSRIFNRRLRKRKEESYSNEGIGIQTEEKNGKGPTAGGLDKNHGKSSAQSSSGNEIGSNDKLKGRASEDTQNNDISRRSYISDEANEFSDEESLFDSLDDEEDSFSEDLDDDLLCVNEEETKRIVQTQAFDAQQGKESTTDSYESLKQSIQIQKLQSGSSNITSRSAESILREQKLRKLFSRAKAREQLKKRIERERKKEALVYERDLFWQYRQVQRWVQLRTRRSRMLRRMKQYEDTLNMAMKRAQANWIKSHAIQASLNTKRILPPQAPPPASHSSSSSSSSSSYSLLPAGPIAPTPRQSQASLPDDHRTHLFHSHQMSSEFRHHSPSNSGSFNFSGIPALPTSLFSTYPIALLFPVSARTTCLDWTAAPTQQALVMGTTDRGRLRIWDIQSERLSTVSVDDECVWNSWVDGRPRCFGTDMESAMQKDGKIGRLTKNGKPLEKIDVEMLKGDVMPPQPQPLVIPFDEEEQRKESERFGFSSNSLLKRPSNKSSMIDGTKLPTKIPAPLFSIDNSAGSRTTSNAISNLPTSTASVQPSHPIAPPPASNWLDNSHQPSYASSSTLVKTSVALIENNEMPKLTHLPVVTCIACSPSDPSIVAYASSSPDALPLKMGSLLRSHQLDSLPSLSSFTEHHTPREGRLGVVNIRQMKLVQRMVIAPFPCLVHSIHFNRKGDAILCACDDGAVRLFSCGKSEPLVEWKMHKGPCFDVAWTVDESSFVSVGADGQILQQSIRIPTLQLFAYNPPSLLHTSSQHLHLSVDIDSENDHPSLSMQQKSTAPVFIPLNITVKGDLLCISGTIFCPNAIYFAADEVVPVSFDDETETMKHKNVKIENDQKDKDDSKEENKPGKIEKDIDEEDDEEEEEEEEWEEEGSVEKEGETSDGHHNDEKLVLKKNQIDSDALHQSTLQIAPPAVNSMSHSSSLAAFHKLPSSETITQTADFDYFNHWRLHSKGKKQNASASLVNGEMQSPHTSSPTSFYSYDSPFLSSPFYSSTGEAAKDAFRISSHSSVFVYQQNNATALAEVNGDGKEAVNIQWHPTDSLLLITTGSSVGVVEMDNVSGSSRNA
ncbi:uncharacterized protein MONOS_7737 [Monocercomonoides exilis]|uniref:uncharacterized protein n=1 Tax=Monocercomonoides exilis TaxID=2049356 RepID=UPI003559DF21|nr:hypothetical protein MONOS_7737 [Monocercomonoides exilis]|eukprot:MONOS_7737.1-p1 / transcript=MONOS_7737.1 / gene=MONOS_7737 / organism=Monocercomonoides_exilis_PA203 / gene_product=unspecified product / transcript_product=unspecified product / location=Mono_scaffold00272:53732-61514(-) / protein_length=2513 / sequence_SO=supercontig / SO=protein_coding / is_pseudo=false